MFDEMNKLPTDLEILEEIYTRYFEIYASHTRTAPRRSSKVYVPIDVKALADHFRTDPDIIFGRLYYHLEPKHGFSRSDGSKVPFFTLKAGEDKQAVQFPLLASVLAGLREERGKHLWATWVSIAALVVSITSIVISIATSKP